MHELFLAKMAISSKLLREVPLLLGLIFSSLIPVLSLFFTCVFVWCVFVCVRAHASEHTYTRGLVLVWRPKHGVFLGCYPPYILEKGLSLEPITHLINLARLTIELALGIPFRPPKLWDYRQTGCLLGNCIICMDSNSYPHTWVPSGFPHWAIFLTPFLTFMVPTHVSKSCS